VPVLDPSRVRCHPPYESAHRVTGPGKRARANLVGLALERLSLALRPDTPEESLAVTQASAAL